jgi:lysM domain protein
LKFEPVDNGGRINASFQLIHYLYNGNVESIAY